MWPKQTRRRGRKAWQAICNGSQSLPISGRNTIRDLLLRTPTVSRDVRRNVTGSPRTVRDEIARQIEESGANYFITRFAYGHLSHAQSTRSLELFVSEIMPHFK